MCFFGSSSPPPPPKIPDPLPIESLVAKTAKDIKPAKSRRRKKKSKDKFNLNQKTFVPTLGGLSRTGQALSIDRTK